MVKMKVDGQKPFKNLCHCGRREEVLYTLSKKASQLTRKGGGHLRVMHMMTKNQLQNN